MLTGEEVMEVQILRRQGMSIRGIAKRMGLSRNTVRNYLREPGERAYGPRVPKAGKLDPFREYLAERVRAAHPDRLPATVLLGEIRSRGYGGGISILRDYLRELRPEPVEEPVVQFETEPGEQMQVDFCIFRRGRDRLSAFIAVLGYSRAAFVRFVCDERLETLLSCHEDAFAFFGGVPRTVLYDNMKTVVIERDGYGPGRHRFHPCLRDFAGHHGFMPRLCRPYRAKTKGKVERFIQYLRHSFVTPLASRLKQAGLELDAVTANAEVRTWLRETANSRVHATTNRVPMLLLQEERPCLGVLPPPWRQAAQPSTDGRTFKDMNKPLQRDLAVYEALLHAAAREARQ